MFLFSFFKSSLSGSGLRGRFSGTACTHVNMAERGYVCSFTAEAEVGAADIYAPQNTVAPHPPHPRLPSPRPPRTLGAGQRACRTVRSPVGTGVLHVGQCLEQSLTWQLFMTDTFNKLSVRSSTRDGRGSMWPPPACPVLTETPGQTGSSGAAPASTHAGVPKHRFPQEGPILGGGGVSDAA